MPPNDASRPYSPECVEGTFSEMHVVSRVASPQKHRGDGRRVYFYAARNFLAMLKDAPIRLDALEN